jgi:hypothetical protein
MALPRQVFDNVAEVQVLLRRIHPPTEQNKEKRCETGKGGKSGQDLPEHSRQ